MRSMIGASPGGRGDANGGTWLQLVHGGAAVAPHAGTAYARDDAAENGHRAVVFERRAAGRAGSGGAGIFLVPGRLPDRGGLLLDACLSAWNRVAGGGNAGAGGDTGAGGGDAGGGATGVRGGGAAIVCGTGLDRDAREPARRLEIEDIRAGAAGFRGHRFRDHDDAVGG